MKFVSFLIKKLCLVLVVWSFPCWGQQSNISENSPQRGTAAKIKGDYNKDGKVDFRDKGLLWWLHSKKERREMESKPEIKSFRASPAKISNNEKSTLIWNVEGLPQRLVIDKGVGDVTGKTRIEVRPSRTTNYTLTAENSEGSTHAVAVVEVVPKIISFTASPNVIRNEGETSTLRWRVSGRHTCISIDRGVGEVTGETSVQVSSTGTYTLKVFDSFNEGNPCSGSFASRRVTVNGVPYIDFFRANPSAIGNGAVSTLSWRIQGEASRVFINQGVGDVRGLDSVEVSPENSTTYTLTAVNNYGRSTQTVTVSVLALPVIESFTVSRSLVGYGFDGGVQLRWRVSGSESFQLKVEEIDNDENRKITSSCRNLSSTRTSCYIYPRETRSYILTASNSLGAVESESLRVDVLKLNTPDPSSIVEGDSSQLSWEGSESAEILRLEKREGRTGSYGSPVNVAGLESYEVSPDVTTYYRLKARHGDSSRFVYSNSRIVQIGGITSFSANPPFVVKFDNSGVSDSIKEEEGETRLRWSLANVANSRINVLQTINGNETDITRSCRVSGCTVTPGDSATTYTLRVRDNNDLDITKQLTVGIFKIGRFKGASGSVSSSHQNCSLTRNEDRAVGDDHYALECLNSASGQSVNLSWEGLEGYNSLNLKTCQLENSSDSSCTETMQSVTGTSFRVTPSGFSSIYTLTAQKQVEGYSKTIELKVKVQVRDEVQVQVFRADDRIIKEGVSDQTTRLNWSIVGKDPVEFELYKRPEGDSSEEIFSRTSPGASKQSHYTYSFADSNDKKTTEFTLTAENAFGSPDDETIKVYYLKMGPFTAVDNEGNNSSAEDCSGADQCLTVTSETDVTLKWDGIEGFGDERTSSCGGSGQPECITDTLEITWNRDSGKITLPDDQTQNSVRVLTGSTGDRIKRAPTSTAVYTLTVKKQVGSEVESISKTVKVIVQDTPSVSSLTAREGSSNTSDLNRILNDAETSTYLHYAHTGKDPYNLKLEEKPQGESSFTTGGGFNTCASNGGDSCKDYRQVTPTKTTEYKLTLEKPAGTAKDTQRLKIYKLGVERFKARVRRSGENIDSCNRVSGDDNNCVTLSRSACSGADECLTVTRNESITFSWSGITGFEDERSGDFVQISKNASDACSSSSYEDDSNPSTRGSVTFRSSGTAGVCTYTLTVQKTLGSGNNEETEKVTKTIKVSVDNPSSIDYFESRTSTSREDNMNIKRIIQNSGSTTLLWKIFSFTDSDTFKLKSQKEGESSADFETISPSCTLNPSSPSYVECSHVVSSIDKTTTYTLEATSAVSGQKVTSRPLKVYVLKVDSFEGTRRRDGSESTSCTISGGLGECVSVEQGASSSARRVALEWMIEGFGGEGADTLEIEPNVQTGHGLTSCSGNPCKKNVKGRSSITLSPTETTIYTLVAKKVIGNEEISHSKKVRITVGTRPTISTLKFTDSAHPNPIVTICSNCPEGDVEWVVSGGVSKLILIKETVNDDGEKVSECTSGTGTYPDCTDLLSLGSGTSDGRTQFTTPRTTKYILRAENAVGESERSITVKVFRVIEFTADPACISSGGSSRLSWKVAEGVNGANSVSIDNSVGNQSSSCSTVRGIETICSGSVSVNPSANTTYNLTAKKPTGIDTDITGNSATVSVGGCSGLNPQKKVSSVLQDCSVCPKMFNWKFLKGSSNSDSGYSLDQQMRWIGNSQLDLEPYLQKGEMPVSEEGLVEQADSIRDNKDRTSQEKHVSGKITYSEYQACVDEGVCSPLSMGGSLSLMIDRQTIIGEFNEQDTPLSQESTSLQEQGSDQNLSAEFVSEGSSLGSVEGGYSSSEGFENEEVESDPVAFISLSSALEYARWLSDKTEKSYGVLADPLWADGVEDSSPGDFEKFNSFSPLYNQNGVLLYAVHSKEFHPSTVYSGLIESLLENEQREISQGSNLSAMEGETAFDDESVSHNHSSVEALHPDQGFSQGLSSDGFIFRSGFHVIRPL